MDGDLKEEFLKMEYEAIPEEIVFQNIIDFLRKKEEYESIIDHRRSSGDREICDQS